MSSNLTFRYEGLITKQRNSSTAPLLFLFQAQASEVMKWAFVDRLSPSNDSGSQRNANPRRVNEIRRFLDGDERNVIPTAVVLAFRPGASVQTILETSAEALLTLKTLSPGQSIRAAMIISSSATSQESGPGGDDSKPAVVIDGQHRLLGMAKSQDEYIVNAVALLGADNAEIAFQFLVINNKAQRVDRKHLTNLNINFNKDDLNKRLADAAKLGIDAETLSVLKISAFHPDSPFFNLLDMPQCETRWIVPNAVETAYNFVLAKSPADLEEEDRIWFFLYIWKEVREFWSSQHAEIWAKAGKFTEPGSKLLSKVGVICLTDYLITAINSIATIDVDPPDFRIEATVRSKTRQLLERFESEFFLVAWKKTELDTKAGREIVAEAIGRVADNIRYKRPWYHEVMLIDSPLS